MHARNEWSVHLALTMGIAMICMVIIIVGGNLLSAEREETVTDGRRPRRFLHEARRLASESFAIETVVPGSLCAAGGVRLCHQTASGRPSFFTPDGTAAWVENVTERRKHERGYQLQRRRAVIIKNGTGQKRVETDFAGVHLASD